MTTPKKDKASSTKKRPTKKSPTKKPVTTPKGWTQPGILRGRSGGLTPQAFAAKQAADASPKKDKKS